MSFSKTLAAGDAGSIVVSEAMGIVTLKLDVGASMGGGAMAGVVKANAGAQVDVGALQLINVVLDMAKEKVPSIASIIDGAKVMIEAELKK